MPNNNEISVDMALDIQDFEENLKKSEKLAQDTGKKISQATVLRMRLNIDELQQKVKQAQTELKKLDPSSKEAIKLRLDIGQYKRNITEAKRQLNNYVNTGDKKLSRLQRKFNQVNSTSAKLLKTLGSYIGITFVFQKITQAFNFAADAFRKYETAFAGFRKTLNATEPELIAIEKGIVNMSKAIPKSVEELSKIAELGGQMGIAADDILQFTKVVAQLSTAIDGVSAEEAATTLARLQAQTGANIDSLDRLGAALVELGNNFKANEGEILNFANEIKAAGGIVGLSAQDVLGISAAFVDAGIKAEAGGTAVTKALLKIDDQVNQSGKMLGEYAEISGKTKDQFVSDWQNDSANAFADVLSGISESGDEANSIIEKLFGSDIRLKKAMLAVANAGGTLEDAIKSANEEFIEGNALVDEFNKKLKTQESQVIINENRWSAWSASMGESFGKVKLLFSNLFLDVIPTAFAVTSFGITLLERKFQNGLSNIAIIFTYGIQAVASILSGLVDVFKGVGTNAGILIDNMGVAFEQGLPNAVKVGANAAIKLLENFINKVGGGISGLLSKIPGLEGLNDLGNISLGGITFDVDNTGLKEFEDISFKHTKAVAKNMDFVRNRFRSMKDENEQFLQNEALRLETQRKLASKEAGINQELSKLTTEAADEKEKAREKEINSIANLRQKLSDYQKELEGAEIGGELFNRLTEEIEKTQKELDVATDKIEKTGSASKEAAEEIKKAKEEEEDAQEELNKKIEKGQDTVQDFYKEVSKGSETSRKEVEKLKDQIAELNKELEETSDEKDVALAERKLEIIEEQAELEKELKDLKKEESSVENIEKIKEIEDEIKNLKAENIKLEAEFDKEVFDELQEYKSLSKTEQILADFENAKKAIEDEKAEVLKSLEEQEKEYQKIDKIKRHLETEFTSFLKIETDQRVSELERIKQAALAAAAAMRSAGIKTATLQSAGSATTEALNNVTIEQNNNFNAKLTRDDMKRISNDLAKGATNATTGNK